MPKRFSPAVIGGFVVASLAVLVGTLLIIGSGKLFSRPYRFVCMFPGTLNGLKVGSAVKVRGVKVGTVAKIKLVLSASEGKLRPDLADIRLPVFIDIDKTQVQEGGGTGVVLGHQGFQDMLKRGLRAQLNVESLLTGVLYIDLDLHPETPMDLAIVPGSGEYREIPTVPTTMAKLQERLTRTLEHLQSVDLEALASSIVEAANSIKDLTSSPALKATLETLKDTTVNFNKAAVSVRAAVQNTDAKLGPLLIALRRNSEELNATMQEARATFASVRATLDPDAPLLVHLDATMEQMSHTTRSIGELTDYLQRNPASLIRGKYLKDGSAPR